jgi:uncharacterized protein
MERTLDLVLSPHAASSAVLVHEAAARALGVEAHEVKDVRVIRRSVDGRSRTPRIRLQVRASTGEPLAPEPAPVVELPDVRHAEPVVIVGAGPAGLFAALRCIALGRKPIVLERGKDVRARRRDLAELNRRHIVDPDSNYCFGEGGAGTYSDGKLYTRSTKRGNVQEVLRMLVAFGAPPDILVDAHPHIGTNKLPAIIIAIREAIVQAGGEVHFGRRVVGLTMSSGGIAGIRLAGGEGVDAQQVVLATGHGARDIYVMLHQAGIGLEAKDFALGVRVEHPQVLIDCIRYHSALRDPHLPPASYSVVEQVEGLGVYSFCMCPGGIIAPCATGPRQVVTNGWSPSKRDNPYANSGIVVQMQLPASTDVLVGMHAQAAVEERAWSAGGGSQTAPAQRLEDFIQGRTSSTLPLCSYIPGVASVDLHSVLPLNVAKRLRTAFIRFEQKMRGYRTNEAILLATESRTSSPVRIPRDAELLEHPQVRGLYPCGEGAGYAGGIVSAAMDGLRVANALCAVH